MKLRHMTGLLVASLLCSYACSEDKDDSTDAKQCPGYGEILRESDNTCVCDSSRNFTGTAGACECKNGFSFKGDRCVDATPGHECTNKGEVYDESAGSCICDASRNFTGTPGSCTCKDNYKPEGDNCVENISPNQCSNPGEVYNEVANACVCNVEGHWVGNAGSCVCDADYHQQKDNQCVKCTQYEYWDDVEKLCLIDYSDTTEYCKNKFKDLKAGDTVTFGHYIMAASGSTTEPIEWNVLERKEDGSFILNTKNVLEAKRFSNEKGSGIVHNHWEDCTLRSWLNGYGADENFLEINYTNDNFIKASFSNEETECLKAYTITTSSHATVNDRVFLLDPAEIREYYPTASDRIAYSTPHTKAIMVEHYYTSFANCISDGYCAVLWWTRSPGGLGPSTVRNNGEFSLNGTPADSDEAGVRPAVRVK